MLGARQDLLRREGQAGRGPRGRPRDWRACRHYHPARLLTGRRHD